MFYERVYFNKDNLTEYLMDIIIIGFLSIFCYSFYFQIIIILATYSFSNFIKKILLSDVFFPTGTNSLISVDFYIFLYHNEGVTLPYC